MKHHETEPISQRIKEQIAGGRVHVKTRGYFALRGVLFAVGTALVAAALLYIASFTAFSLRVSGAWFAPAAGWRGFGVLLRSFPWLVIALAGGFVVLLEMLVQRYAVAYRRPLLYSAIAVVLLVSLGSFIISRTPLHPAAFRGAEAGQLPFAGPLYRDLGAPQLRDVHRGVVTKVTPDGFVLTTRRGQAITVATGTLTNIGSNEPLDIGDLVLVLGELKNETVAAWDVRVIPDDLPPPPGLNGERYRQPRPY